MSTEKDIAEIKEDIKDIKFNHLASLYKMIGELKGQVWYIIGAGTVTVLLVIAILAVILAR